MQRTYQYNTWKDIEALDREHTIVVVPLGATEQHGHQDWNIMILFIRLISLVIYLKEQYHIVYVCIPYSCTEFVNRIN